MNLPKGVSEVLEERLFDQILDKQLMGKEGSTLNCS